MSRRSRGGTPQDSYLVSISDLMAALLFFFIIALAAMVRHYHEKADPWTHVEQDRTWLLQKLEDELQAAGLRNVQADYRLGLLHLPDEILFDKNHFRLRSDAVPRVSALRRALLRWLPCLTPEHAADPACRDEDGQPRRSRLDTFIIEGHTDSDPVEWDRVRGNWKLSSQRAITLYLELTRPEPTFPYRLNELHNDQGQSLFAVAGYADTRPRCTDDPDSEECKSRNRRIDIRLIVVPGPWSPGGKAR